MISKFNPSSKPSEYRVITQHPFKLSSCASVNNLPIISRRRDDMNNYMRPEQTETGQSTAAAK
jgi:hypothetical protein